MKILHVVPSYLPAMRYGGPIYSVHGLCKGLVRIGHDVEVFTTNIDGPHNSPVPLGQPVDLNGVRVSYFAVPALRRLYWSPQMAEALDRRARDFDVIHTHSVFLWPTLAAVRRARRERIPYVCSPRGMLVKDLVRRKSRYLKRAWIAAFERANLETADAIHVTSAEEARALREFGFRLRRVEVIPNGVDLEAEVTSDGKKPVRRFEEIAAEPTLLFLGRISWKKGLDRLIKSLLHIPRGRLVIAGNDEENYQPVLEKLANELGVGGRITFVGPVYSPAEKTNLLRRASLLVLPSYSENFGNVVLEAMAQGCPVVVTPEVGAADIVRESQGGIVVNGDPGTFGGAVAALLGDSDKLRAMSDAGQTAIRAHFGWDGVARQMEGLYKSIMLPPSPSETGSRIHARP